MQFDLLPVSEESCIYLYQLKNQSNKKEIEPAISAENNWMDHVEEVASNTLRYSCNSWYVGANVPGKKRVFMPYIGGQDVYRKKCKDISNNDYEGFIIN